MIHASQLKKQIAINAAKAKDNNTNMAIEAIFNRLKDEAILNQTHETVHVANPDHWDAYSLNFKTINMKLKHLGWIATNYSHSRYSDILLVPKKKNLFEFIKGFFPFGSYNPGF